MIRIGLIADFRHDMNAGPQVAKLLRNEGLEVTEISRDVDLHDDDKRVHLSQLFASVDCLYNIGRNKQAGAYLDLAHRRIPYINHWIGTEVLDLVSGEGNFAGRQFIEDIDVHLACAPWIAEELKQIEITARVVPIVSFDRKMELDTPPPRHAVLSYLLQGRSKFYGIEAIAAAAKALPQIPFYIVGNDGRGEVVQDNIIYLGWLNSSEMEDCYRKCSILLRYPLHDGLSMMVVEALGKGKEVVYNHPYAHCHFVRSHEEIIEVLDEITRIEPKANVDGHRLVTNTLSKRVLGAQMRDIFMAL